MANMPITSTLLKKHKSNNILIETGSYFGEGIKAALEAGFDKIISIELSEKYYNICKNLYHNNRNVELIHGDSFDILPLILKNIDQPITFWLDGHYSGGDTAIGKLSSPLIQELIAIESSSIKNHTLIIDDMRCWANENDGINFSQKDIIYHIYQINKNYKIIYADNIFSDGVMFAEDILIAFMNNNSI